MDCEVVLAGEGLGAVGAGVLVLLGVCPLVATERMTPLEGLPALETHVLPVRGVRVHVAGQVLLDPGGVVAQWAPEVCWPNLGLPCPLLGPRIIRGF